MFDAFRLCFTICSGVYKIKVIHMTYPQAVYNSGDKKHFAGNKSCFPRFLEEKHLFSVDNPVYSVYKPVKNKKNVNRLCGMIPSVDRILFRPVSGSSFVLNHPNSSAYSKGSAA